MAEVASIRVGVVLAEAHGGPAVEVELPAGATAWQAVERSRLLEDRPGLDAGELALAIFGRLVPRGQPLEAGDRVEILRPLPEDPKERRRQLAREGRAMGRGRGAR
jgi:putative ubiquitin-RnfH superfamily antitoxin RatB of RatAB toxin-antitoxin module